jgi:hypothetical protein
MRRLSTAVCGVLLCCVYGCDDQTIALLASPRVLLACGLLIWLRCEWRAGQECVRVRVDDGVVVKTEDSATVKENYKLSQTVMNLSDQHKLLCEIRTSVLKTSKYSREALLELRVSVCERGSHTSSRRGSAASFSKSMPDEHQAISPLAQPCSFRHGSVASSSNDMPEVDEFSVGSPAVQSMDSPLSVGSPAVQSTDSRARAAFRQGGMSKSCGFFRSAST